MTTTPQSQGVSGMTTLPTTPTREEGCVITTLPPLICSIGGTPYNEDHLAWKDKKISTLTTENARLAERVRVLEGALKPFAEVEFPDPVPEGALVFMTLRTHGPCQLSPNDFRRARTELKEKG